MSGPPRATFARDATGLVRELKFIDVVFLSIMSSSPLTALITTTLYAPYFFPGVDIPVIFVVGILPAVAMAIVYGILGGAMPRSGGDYVWSSRIMGPFYGTIQWVMLVFTLIILIASFTVIIPISLFLPQLLFSLGATTNNMGLINAVSTVTNSYNGLGINYIFLLIAIGVALFSLKYYVIIQRGVFVVVFLVWGTIVACLLSLSSSSFPGIFNHAMASAGSSVTFSGVLQEATSGGLASGFNTTNTLLAILPWGFFSYVGFNWSTYLAGEMKNAKSTITKALLTAIVIFMVMCAVPVLIAYNTIGANFLDSASFVAANNPSYLPTPPTLSVLLSFISPAAAVLIGVGILITLPIFVAGISLNISRMIFATSFDRVLPTKFADVNQKTQSPVWAVLLVGACYAVLLPAYWLTSWAAVLLNTSEVLPIAASLPIVAAIVFYFKKPELFAQTIGGRGAAVRLISVSFVALACFVIFAFAEAVPLSSSLYLGASLGAAFEVVGVLLLLGILLYVVTAYRFKRMGLDIKNIYTTIPPE